MTDRDCVFCRIITYEEPATILMEGVDSVAIRPLNPCTDGHLLVIPRQHVQDAYEDPTVTAATMRDAALWPRLLADRHRDDRYDSVNIITSVGEPATQTVLHLHLHVVPRRHNDGLSLPWGDHQR